MNKKFSCAKCGHRLQIRYLFLLSNNSKIECKQCHTINKPEKFGNWYFLIGMFPTVIATNLYLRKKDAIFEALLFGLCVGMISYSIVLVYVYNTVKFKEC
jgi:hypothetical protein